MELFSPLSLGLLALCFFTWLLFWYVSGRQSESEVIDYQQVNGEVLGCWRDELSSPNEPPSGDLWVRVRYEWQGKSYTSEDVADEDDPEDGFMTGSMTPVWVHPNRPDDGAIHAPQKGLGVSDLFSGGFVFLVLVSWLVLLVIVALF